MIISLIGGPKDGQTIELRHGDDVKFLKERPLADALVKQMEAGADHLLRVDDRDVYRRSTVNPAVFVWQGEAPGTEGPATAYPEVQRRDRGREERLVDLLCLADKALMLSHGSFPLDPGPLREACLLIRATTGDDYKRRLYRAARARGEAT